MRSADFSDWFLDSPLHLWPHGRLSCGTPEHVEEQLQASATQMGYHLHGWSPGPQGSKGWDWIAAGLLALHREMWTWWASLPRCVPLAAGGTPALAGPRPGLHGGRGMAWSWPSCRGLQAWASAAGWDPVGTVTSADTGREGRFAAWLLWKLCWIPAHLFSQLSQGQSCLALANQGMTRSVESCGPCPRCPLQPLSSASWTPRREMALGSHLLLVHRCSWVSAFCVRHFPKAALSWVPAPSPPPPRCSSAQVLLAASQLSRLCKVGDKPCHPDRGARDGGRHCFYLCLPPTSLVMGPWVLLGDQSARSLW